MNIKFTEKYHVNPEKKTTVCILELKNADDCKFITHSMDLLKRMSVAKGIKLPTRQPVPTKFTGTAYCHPDDEFDSTVGRKIARDRAYTTFIRFARNFERQVISDCLFLFTNFKIENLD